MDKFFERMSIEVNECVKKEKAFNPKGMVDCFSKFEYLLRHQVGKLDL